MFKIKITTYEQDRLNYFTALMNKSQKTYKRLFAKFKDAPYLSAEATALSDAGREVQFLADCVEMLDKGYRKQEWISVDDRLPEEREDVIVFCEDGLVGEAWHKKKGLFWWTDDRDGIAAATHWMPLPEPPKMKGGAE